MEGREQSRNALSRLLSAALVVAVVIGVTFTLLATQQRGQPGPGAQPTLAGVPVRISTGVAAAIRCPSAAAFSPDGTRIAVIGAALTCDDAENASTLVPHLLALFDTQSGTLLESIALDPLVGARDYASRQPHGVRAARYVALGWSPDGRHVGMVYGIFDAASRIEPDDLLDSGFLLVDTLTYTGTVIHGDAGFFAAPTSSYAGLPVWDLAHRTVSAPEVSTPSLAYAWSPSGQAEAISPLGAAPLKQLPVTAGPRYPVGNPDGDATYTIWQTGVVMGPEAVPSGSDVTPGDGAFVSWYPAWSPKGTTATLMVTGVALPALADAADESSQPGGSPDIPMPQSMTRVPARDAALRAVQQEIGAAGWAVVAWNPAGTVLASVTCTAGQDETLRLRASDTGAEVSTDPLPLGAGDPGCRGSGREYGGDYPNPNLWLQWSADGSHLLVNDQAAGMVDVWSVRRPST